jgi:hypothetical protein
LKFAIFATQKLKIFSTAWVLLYEFLFEALYLKLIKKLNNIGMKKLLLTGLVLVNALAAFAQAPQIERIHPQDTKIGGILPKQRIHTSQGDFVTTKRAETLSGQYNYVSSYGETQMIGTASTYVRWLTEDTNALTIFTDGTSGRGFIHTMGSVFDPKDSSYQITGQPVLTRFNPYTVDTIRWLQFYVRNADSMQRIQFRDSVMQDTVKVATFDTFNVEIVDTLFVQYFNFQGLGFASIVGGTNLFGYPNPATYRAATLLNTAALSTDTILFRTGDGDSVDRFAGSLFSSLNGVVPNNLRSLSTNAAQVNANVIGFCLVFKNMQKAKFNDTFMNWSEPTYRSKINGYGVRAHYWENIAVVSETPYRYNNTFWTPSVLRNGVRTSNGWQSYYPTSIYTTSTLLGYWIDITTQNASVEALKNGVADLKVFPNPSNQGDNVVVNFELNDNASVNVEVMDINGRIVAVQNNDMMNRGINEVQISTSNFAPGVYMVNVKSTVGAKTAKFIVR